MSAPTPYQMALALSQREPEGGMLNSFVRSVVIHRLKALDVISTTVLDIGETDGGAPIRVRIPNDIDDPDLSNVMIQNLIDSGKTPQEILKTMKEGGKRPAAPIEISTPIVERTPGLGSAQGTVEDTPIKIADQTSLQWQRSVEDTYKDRLVAYYRQVKKKYTDLVSAAIEASQVSTGPALPLNEQFEKWDVTQYCKITDISGDLDFNNQASIDISLVEFRKVHGEGAVIPMLPKENDVLEIVVCIPDGQGGYQDKQFFLGIVTGISLGKEYGQINNITLLAYGVSKMLVINKMVTNRAIISQFEGGALAEVGLTVWSNYFANQTVADIFQFLMTNEVGMKVTRDSLGKLDEPTQLSLEQTEGLSLKARVEAQLALIKKGMSKGDVADADRELDKKWMGDVSSSSIQELRERASGIDRGTVPPSSNSTKLSAKQSAAQAGTTDVNIILSYDEAAQSEKIRKGYFVGLTFNTPSQSDYAVKVLTQYKIDGRIAWIKKRMAELKKQKVPSTGQHTFEMEFDKVAFSSPDVFQMLYVPLISIAVFKMSKADKVVARFKGRDSAAFDLMLRDSFELFFSQLQSPASLLEELRKVAKMQVYENEQNQIIAELPRYNEFIADPNTNEQIQDFIIANPFGKSEVVKQDMGLVTRYDVKQFMPMIGYQPYTMTSRQFTDIAVLSKYGMRADAPKQNPNAKTEQSAQLFAALEVTTTNALTRTISLVHPVDRQFKLGRLYFFAIDDLEKKMGGPNGFMDTDGYVGYLTGFRINTDYGNVLNYSLNFQYVRKAKLIISAAAGPMGNDSIVANFKILPDLGSLIDSLEKAAAEGKTAPLGGPTQEPVQGEADTVQDMNNEGRLIYVVKHGVPDGGRLYEAPPVIEISGEYVEGTMAPLFTQQQGAPPETPSSTNHFRTLKDQYFAVPVVVKADVSAQSGGGGGSIKEGMAYALNVLDLRIRQLGRNLLENMKLRNSKDHEAYSGEGGIAERRLKDWTPMYIPSVDINPWFHWMDLKQNGSNDGGSLAGQSVGLSIVSPLDPISFTNLGKVKRFLWGNYERPIRVKFVGSPILVNDSKKHFVILHIDDSKWENEGPISTGFWSRLKVIGNFLVPDTTTEASEKIGITGASNNYPAGFNNSAGYGMTAKVMFTASVINDHKTKIRDAMATLSGSDIDVAALQAEVDAAIKSLGDNYTDEDRAMFLPVLIHAEVPSVVAKHCAFTGIPFTLIDAAAVSDVIFTGNLPASTGGAVMQDAHSNGQAADVSLVPFYVSTGLRLNGSEGDGYPFLSASYKNPGDKIQLTSYEGSSPSYYVFKIGGQDVKNKDITASALNLTEHTTSTKSLFAPVSGYFASIEVVNQLYNGLRREDRHWWHVGAYNVDAYYHKQTLHGNQAGWSISYTDIPVSAVKEPQPEGQ